MTVAVLVLLALIAIGFRLEVDRRRIDRLFNLAVAEFIATDPAEWVTSLRLRNVFGWTVYSTLHDLETRGLLERKEGHPLAERGGRPAFYYRLKVRP